MPVILGILKLLGPTVCTAIAIILYYEGIPVIDRLPYIGNVPFIGDLAIGEKRSYAATQVKNATANMVKQAELDVANALLKKAQDEAAFNAAVAEAARKQADNAAVEAKKANDELEKRIAQDTSDDGCTVSDTDLDWLHFDK